jgi:CheY-like chemotaxis protein
VSAGSFRSPHILIVEDDSSTAYSIFYTLQSGLPEGATLRMAYGLEDAKEWVVREQFNVVLLDFSLPDGTGMDLIELLMKRSAASQPFIFLISGLDPDRFDVASILIRYPEITFVEKPFRYEALVDLVLDRILPHSIAEQDYYGLQLFDLIQAYSIARRSATIRVLTADGKMGVIALDHGEVVHAVMDGAEGVEALKKLARSTGGRIRLDRGCPTARRTITQPTQRVLIEAYRLLDEDIDPSERKGEETAGRRRRSEEPQNGGEGDRARPVGGHAAPDPEIDSAFNEAFITDL